MEQIELGPIERRFGAGLAGRTGACPPASDLVEFVDRGESAGCFGAVVAHLAGCPNCRQILLEMRSADAMARPVRKTFFRPYALFGGLLAGTAALTAIAAMVVSQPRPHRSPDARVAQVTQPPQKRMETQPLVAIRPTPKPVPLAGGQAPTKVAEVQSHSGPGVKKPTVPTPNDIDDPSMPPTSQQYCLIGSDGVFTMPTPNYHRAEREQIEKRYADKVKAAHDAYSARLTSQPDPAPASEELNRTLMAAGSERDHALGEIYTKQPADPRLALDLKLEGETPYQVVEVHYRSYQHALRPVKVLVHEPWPGYRPMRKPYGWEYGVAYEPGELKSRYAEWRKGYVAQGRPAFCGLEGHGGPVSLPNIVGSRYEGYADRRRSEIGPTPGHYTHDAVPSATGYTHSGVVTQSTPPGRGAQSPTGYTHSGGYTHPTPTPPATGYSHSPKPSGGNSTYTHQRHEGRDNENGGF